MNGSPFMSIRYCNKLTVKLVVRLRMYTMGNCDSYLNLHRNHSFAKKKRVVIRLAVKEWVGTNQIALKLLMNNSQLREFLCQFTNW